MLRILLLAGLVLAPAAPPQEETLDQVIEKWEASAAALRPLRLAFDKTGTPGPCDVEADRDGNVRVALHPYYGRAPDGAPTREWFLAPRGLHVIDHLPTIHPSRGVPIRRAERLEPAACAEHDPSHFPNPQAVQGVTLNESAHGIFLLLLSPRRALAFERNLQLLGRRDVDGEPCWILRAEKTLSFQNARQVRRFFISVRDHRLRRVDQVFRWPRAHHGDRSLWTFTYGEGPLPARLEFATTRNPFEGDWDIAAAKRDPPASPIAPPDDLYATRARYTNVAELAAASPDDPEILASLAIQRGDVADWEKVAALSSHETPRLNLLRIAAGAKATNKVLKLAEAVENDPKASRPVILEAARALVQVGRSELALPLLDRFGADPPDDARRLRAYAWKELKDLKKVMAESLPMILRKDNPQLWIDFAGLPDADVRREIDAAVEANPTSAALRVVRLRELARMKRIGGIAGALRDCLAAKVDDNQLYSAVQAVTVMIRPHGGGAGIDPEVLRPAAKDLLDVFDPARSLYLRPLRIMIRHALDEKEEAEAELKLLMAEATKAEPKLRSLAWAYVTPDYKL
ncbi:MAG TPA: hypothetical protein VJU16_05560, partial [Planctomycetota bacterium]|nr:hypothetical protein [Planctomycetota bacterium]